MSGRERDNPGVIARPPRIYLAFLLVGMALDYVWPVPVLAGNVRYAVGFALILLGVCVMALALQQFRRAGTSHETGEPATVLVSSGLFRFSRNPIYISLTLIYGGIAIAADNFWTLALLVPTLLVMNRGVIAREERHLERKFGEEYRRYKTSVRRWL